MKGDFMKKLLILLLLSVTTIFTSVNAQTYNGIIFGATYNSSGGYLDFDGVNDYVEVPLPSNWASQNLNDFRIDITYSTTDSNESQLFGYINTTSTTRFDINYNFIGSNKFGFGLANDNNDLELPTINYNLQNGSINTLSVIYNNGNTTILLNGNSQSITYEFNFNDNPSNFSNFLGNPLIGRSGGNPSVIRWANFNLYDFKIYNGNDLFIHYDLDAPNAISGNELINQAYTPFNYPANINLDSNYGDYFDADIQFQDQDELYIDYPISAQSADVNDDWQATAPTSGIGSFVFQDWYDIDNNVVFSTNASLSITNPARDYNLRARYTGVTEYDIDLNMETGVSGSIQYQGNSFNNNSITQLASVIDQTVPDGTSWQATAPNVAGQNFDHWYNLDTNSIYSTNQFIQIASTTSNFNLEARYSPIPTYTFNATSDLPSPPDFQYQVNSGTTQFDYPVSINLNEGDDIQITAPTSGIGFYEFDGWYDISGAPILQSTQPTLSLGNVQEDFSFEARYSLPEEYQIDLTLTSQIGNIQFQIDDQTPIFAPSISETIFAGQDFQATGPSDPSYEFQHWFDLDNNVVFSENLFITAQDVDRDYNLEARYLEIFDITFDTAGGDPINADTAVDGEAYALPTPTREGFIFLGWNDSNDVLPRPIIESPYTITQDVTFIANWVEVITINFNSNGGTAVNPQNVSAGGVITEPAIPSKFGYIFDGWYTDNNTFANEYDFNSSVNTAFTLHAKWVLGSDSDVGETLNTWIADSGISAIFIVLVIMVAVTVTLGLINAQMFVIIISNLSIIFVFTALGFIPVWIVLVSGLALIGFIIMTVFGGSNNA